MPQNRTRLHFDQEYEPNMLPLAPYLLAQVGDLQCEPGYWIQPHQQWVDEISLVISGSATFEADGKTYEIDSGMLFLSGRHEVHAIRSSHDDPMRMLYIGFDFQQPCTGLTAAMQAFFDRPLRRVARSTMDIQRSYMRLMAEIMRDDEISPLLMQACMHEIICSTYRLCHEESESNYLIGDAAASNEKLVHDVMLYLETNPDYADKLQNLSSEFGYSYAHIAKAFTARTGVSLKAYQTQVRFAQARMDMQTGMSVTETAERMGYKSIHAFSKAFKKHEGMTASEFRRYVMENKSSRKDGPK